MKHPFFKKLKKKEERPFSQNLSFQVLEKGRSGLNSVDEMGVWV